MKTKKRHLNQLEEWEQVSTKMSTDVWKNTAVGGTLLSVSAPTMPLNQPSSLPPFSIPTHHQRGYMYSVIEKYYYF